MEMMPLITILLKPSVTMAELTWLIKHFITLKNVSNIRLIKIIIIMAILCSYYGTKRKRGTKEIRAAKGK